MYGLTLCGVGRGGGGGYDQLCCPASPKLPLLLDLEQGCDNRKSFQRTSSFCFAPFIAFNIIVSAKLIFDAVAPK